MRFLRSLTLGLAALAVTACSEVAAPIAPDGPAASVSAVGHMVSGSGHVAASSGQREFTFHAVEQPDGGVTGSYKVVLPNGLFFEADVTCLTVDGNTGWVGGIIRDTNAGVVVVGSTSMFYAIDGGEGEDAVDKVSLAVINNDEGVDQLFCEEQPLELPALTVTDGNVQVR